MPAGITVEAADFLLSTTRAVRRRLDFDRPVPPSVITECLQLAVQAPTASNAQGWRWMIVTDSELRHSIAELYRHGEGLMRAMARRVPEDDAQTKRTYISSFYLSENLERVPVFVIPCIQGRVDGAPPVQVASHYASILPAAWSFMLALRSRGLGSVLTTVHLLKEREVGELLGIPEDVTQMGLLPVAYTIGDDFKPAARGSVDAITSWNGWADD